jgi:hypothetical protein
MCCVSAKGRPIPDIAIIVIAIIIAAYFAFHPVIVSADHFRLQPD